MSEEVKPVVTLSKNAEKILEMVSELSVLELADLVKAMEEKFGVSAAAPMAVAAVGAAAAPAEAAEEKSTFNIELTSAGAQKIAAIKALREIDQNLGLVEAKTIAESAPKVIKEGVKKEEAEKIKKKLEEAGCTVTLK
ncbi:50S ribosomal protein L7/L12 [Candidatus Peregrinibacteria bacterium CG08_land_8_20_14_0_20_41_10]|nr:MAG: 50S ribosomal protein L7/L12 [Candidatus Peregrinibacteria bacterium CG08_land_8_20_14_0_20_41_10]